MSSMKPSVLYCVLNRRQSLVEDVSSYDATLRKWPTKLECNLSNQHHSIALTDFVIAIKDTV